MDGGAVESDEVGFFLADEGVGSILNMFIREVKR